MLLTTWLTNGDCYISGNSDDRCLVARASVSGLSPCRLCGNEDPWTCGWLGGKTLDSFGNPLNASQCHALPPPAVLKWFARRYLAQRFDSFDIGAFATTPVLSVYPSLIYDQEGDLVLFGVPVRTNSCKV